MTNSTSLGRNVVPHSGQTLSVTFHRRYLHFRHRTFDVGEEWRSVLKTFSLLAPVPVLKRHELLRTVCRDHECRISPHSATSDLILLRENQISRKIGSAQPQSDPMKTSAIAKSSARPAMGGDEALGSFAIASN